MRNDSSLRIFRALVLSVLLVCVDSVWAKLDGQGTIDEPYKISSLEDLEEIAKHPSQYQNADFLLTKNLEFAEKQNVMIGTEDYNYCGVFDGDGHTIKVDIDVKESVAGLFRWVRNATIKNLNVTGQLKIDGQFAGGLVGHANGVDIDNCNISVDIISEIEGDGTHGGIVGVNENNALKLQNCTYTGQFYGSMTTSWGGLVGWTWENATIDNCKVGNVFNHAKNLPSSSQSSAIVRTTDSGIDITCTDTYFSEAFETYGWSMKYGNEDADNHVVTRADKVLNTQYIAGKSTKVVAHVKLRSLCDGENYIFGSANSQIACSDFALWVDGKDKSFNFATGSEYSKSPKGMAEVGRDYYITLGNGYFRVDTVADASKEYYHKDFAVFPFNYNELPLYFGACNVNSTDVKGKSDLCIYGVTITRGDTLDCELVPACYGNNGKYGMYDIHREISMGSTDNSEFDGCVNACADGTHVGWTVSNDANGNINKRKCVVCGTSEDVDETTTPYINFGGSNYFDSGYVPNSSTEIKMHFVHHDSNNEVQYLFGTSYDLIRSFYAMAEKDDVRGEASGYPVGLWYYGLTHGMQDGHEYYLTMDMNSMTITSDSEGKNILGSYYCSSTPYTDKDKITMTVGTVTSSAGPNRRCCANYDLFSFQIYEAGDLVHDYVPKAMFGERGFLDKITNEFHPMRGSGGSSNFEVKDESYVTTYGTRRFYDTGYIPNDNTVAKMRVMVDGSIETPAIGMTSYDWDVFGSRDNSSSIKCDYAMCMTYADGKNSKSKGIQFGTASISDSYRSFKPEWNYFVTLSKDLVKITTDSTDWFNLQSAFSKVGTFTSNVSMYIGTVHFRNAPGSRWNTPARFYYFDIYEGSTLKHRFVPAVKHNYKGSTDYYCLYDAVEDKYHMANDGSGECAGKGSINCTDHLYKGELMHDDNGYYRKCRICEAVVYETPNWVEIKHPFSSANCGFYTDYTPNKNTEVRMGTIFESTYDNHSIGTFFGAGENVYNLHVYDKNLLGVRYGGATYKSGYALQSNMGYYFIMNREKIQVCANDNCGSMFSFENPDPDNSMELDKNSDNLIIGNTISLFSVTQKVLSFAVYENGKCVRNYIPAKLTDKNGLNYGMLETLSQKFVYYKQSQSAGNVAECKEHKYIDYKNNDGKWQKHCRVCDKTWDMTQEEQEGGSFVCTNYASYLDLDNIYPNTSGRRIIRNVTDSVNIHEVDIYDGDNLVRRLVPSLHGGKPQFYDTIEGKLYAMKDSLGNDTYVACSAYVPVCEGNHNYYTLIASSDKKTYQKQCMLCNNLENVNVIKGVSVDDMVKIAPEGGDDIYLETVEIDGSSISPVHRHLGKTYPFISSSETYIIEYALMREGKVQHHYLPGKFNATGGFYDENDGKFYEVSGSTPAIYTCPEHTYCVNDSVDGIVYSHCCICDNKSIIDYYRDVVFLAGEGGYGTMAPQRLIADAKLKIAYLNTNSFKCDNNVFNKWRGSDGKTYTDGGKVTVDEYNHSALTLTALWTPAFSYNGDTLAISGKNTSSINIVDDEVHGFATAKQFTAGSISYKRKLSNGLKYGTLCLPFSVEGCDTIDLYTVNSVYQKGNEYRILLDKVEGTVDAGVPCIFRLSDNCDGGMVTFSAGKVPVAVSAGTSGSASLMLNGEFEYTTMKCTDESVSYYGIMNDRFYNVTTAVTVKPYRAYITEDKSTGANAKELYLDFGYDETGIDALELDGDIMSLEDSEIFTIGGMKVEKLQNGINIVKFKDGTVKKVRK